MRLTALAVALLLAAFPARADQLQSDADALADCVGTSWPGDVVKLCSGTVANPCQARPGGETTAGMTACIGREADAWDALLNRQWPELTRQATELDSANDIAAQGLASAARSLQDAQRVWVVFRDAECHHAAATYGAGSFRQAAHAACRLELTARRVVDFHARLNAEE